MIIDITSSAAIYALVGGVLIGLSASLLILGIGRVAGISGIVGALFTPARFHETWRWMFLLGLASSAWLMLLLGKPFAVDISQHYITLMVAGLLVGVGTRYAAGCTSGHGVCGLSRFSLRSLVATLTFMGMGFATVYVVRHVLGSV